MKKAEKSLLPMRHEGGGKQGLWEPFLKNSEKKIPAGEADEKQAWEESSAIEGERTNVLLTKLCKKGQAVLEYRRKYQGPET